MLTKIETLGITRDMWVNMIGRINQDECGSINDFKNTLLKEMGYPYMKYGCPLCEFNDANNRCSTQCLLYNFWYRKWDKKPSYLKICTRDGSPYKIVQEYFDCVTGITKEQAQDACKEIVSACQRRINRYDKD